MESSSTSLWKHRIFQQLFWAHTLSLVGTGLTSLALGLLAHHLVGASASTVLGFTLAIRIAVIVVCSPWAGLVASRFGTRTTMVAADLLRVIVVSCFFFVDSVWQIYLLAVFLNFGSAIFTPIYRAVIPDVVTSEQYPKALAIGSVAYDAANILGPSLAALLIAVMGFQSNFIANAFTFMISACLLFGLPRLGAATAKLSQAQEGNSAIEGLKEMFRNPALRNTLVLAAQVSIAGAFVIVSTVDFIKTDLGLSDSAYAWVMMIFGIGSGSGAVIYGRLEWLRKTMVNLSVPMMLVGLLIVGLLPTYKSVCVAWLIIGVAYSTLGIRGSELLGANSAGAKRPHIYAAHFALSHAGWGITYPIAGIATTNLGFSTTAFYFAALVAFSIVPWHWKARLRD